MTRKTVLSLAIVAALLAGLGVAQYLRAKAPPEAARLLPESDAMVYMQLTTLRAATHFDAAPLHRSADLQQFEDSTGIVPERDLDGMALAFHRMPDPRGPNGPLAYSEVFVGRFDGQKLGQYLAGLARSRETYAGRDIYTIPVEGRQLRVVQLGYDLVAASNTPSPEQIHSMVDRSRTAALSRSGSSLLTARYREVPLLAQAWGIGHIGLPFSEHGRIRLLSMDLPLREDTDLVASLSYGKTAGFGTGGVRLRIEEIAPDEGTAEHSAQAVAALAGIVRGVAGAQTPNGETAAAMAAVLSSVTVDQRANRAILEASATPEQLRSLTAAHEMPAGIEPDATRLAVPAFKR